MNIELIACTVTGASKTGKTCMFISYTTEAFPGEGFCPKVLELYTANVMHHGKPINLQLSDTSSEADYAPLRQMTWKEHTDVALICVDMTNRNTLLDAPTWAEEIKTANPQLPVVLVGTKEDLLEGETAVAQNKLDPTAIVSVADLRHTASLVAAKAVVVTSALTQKGLREVFETAIQVALDSKHPTAAARKGARCSSM